MSVATDPAHIFVSPHLDDAALSCGGRIAALTAAGEACLVVTVCAGVPPPGFAFSEAARRLHRKWGLEDRTAVAARLAEDAAALALLGVERRNLDFLDGLYRGSPTLGERLARRARRLVGLRAAPPAVDRALISAVSGALDAVRRRHPRAAWYAPLAVGHNPDHLAAHAAARELEAAGATVRYYEDFPYAAVPGARDARLAEIGGPQACESAPIGDRLAAKVAAIAAYPSQLPMLFGGSPESMPAAVAAFAAPGACERYWRLR